MPSNSPHPKSYNSVLWSPPVCQHVSPSSATRKNLPVNSAPSSPTAKGVGVVPPPASLTNSVTTYSSYNPSRSQTNSTLNKPRRTTKPLWPLNPSLCRVNRSMVSVWTWLALLSLELFSLLPNWPLSLRGLSSGNGGGWTWNITRMRCPSVSVCRPVWASVALIVCANCTTVVTVVGSKSVSYEELECYITTTVPFNAFTHTGIPVLIWKSCDIYVVCKPPAPFHTCRCRYI